MVIITCSLYIGYLYSSIDCAAVAGSQQPAQSIYYTPPLFVFLLLRVARQNVAQDSARAARRFPTVYTILYNRRGSSSAAAGDALPGLGARGSIDVALAAQHRRNRFSLVYLLGAGLLAVGLSFSLCVYHT